MMGVLAIILFSLGTWFLATVSMVWVVAALIGVTLYHGYRDASGMRADVTGVGPPIMPCIGGLYALVHAPVSHASTIGGKTLEGFLTVGVLYLIAFFAHVIMLRITDRTSQTT